MSGCGHVLGIVAGIPAAVCIGLDCLALDIGSFAFWVFSIVCVFVGHKLGVSLDRVLTSRSNEGPAIQ